MGNFEVKLRTQILPKSKIRFRKTTVAKAQRKYRELMSGLGRVVEE